MNVHIVQKGDTLWKIAKQHQIPFDEIKRLNAHLANPDYIVPGMEIFLPDKTNVPKGKKETPTQPQVSPVPAPQAPSNKETPVKEKPVKEAPIKEMPVKEMPVKETPKPTTPTPPTPPQTSPIQTQPPTLQPVPQPMPMPMPFPMPYPQQMPPIIVPQQPAVPPTIHIEQPPMPQPPAQPMPMQCPSCRMTLMIAMPHFEHKEEVKETKKEPEVKEQKEVQPSPCSPLPMPIMEPVPWRQPACSPPWTGGYCGSCHQPVPVQPTWHWPMQQPQFWAQPAPLPISESPTFTMPQATGNERDPYDLKCEMQQHIVNEYYDEIREIEQSNRPCHPQMRPPMHMPYFEQ